MKTSDISINKVEIKIGKKVLALKLEEAKELKKILNETFPDIVQDFNPIIIKEYIEKYPCQPYRPFWSPTWSCDTVTYSLTA